MGYYEKTDESNEWLLNQFIKVPHNKCLGRSFVADVVPSEHCGNTQFHVQQKTALVLIGSKRKPEHKHKIFNVYANMANSSYVDVLMHFTTPVNISMLRKVSVTRVCTLVSSCIFTNMMNVIFVDHSLCGELLCSNKLQKMSLGQGYEQTQHSLAPTYT